MAEVVRVREITDEWNRSAMCSRCRAVQADGDISSDFSRRRKVRRQEAQAAYIYRACERIKADGCYKQRAVSKIIGFETPQGLNNARKSGKIDADKFAALQRFVRCSVDPNLIYPRLMVKKLAAFDTLRAAIDRVEWTCLANPTFVTLEWTWHLVRSHRFMNALGGEFDRPLRRDLTRLHERVMETCSELESVWPSEKIDFRIGKMESMPGDGELVQYAKQLGPIVIGLIDVVPDEELSDDG